MEICAVNSAEWSKYEKQRDIFGGMALSLLAGY